MGSKAVNGKVTTLECPLSLYVPANDNGERECLTIQRLRAQLHDAQTECTQLRGTIAAQRETISRLDWAKNPPRRKLKAKIAIDRAISKFRSDLATVRKPSAETLDQLKKENRLCPPKKI